MVLQERWVRSLFLMAALAAPGGSLAIAESFLPLAEPSIRPALAANWYVEAADAEAPAASSNAAVPATEAAPAVTTSGQPAATESTPCPPPAPKKKPAKEKQPSNPSCCNGHKFDWAKIPGQIRPMPRPGNFAIPPQPPGYYSLVGELQGKCLDKPPKSGYAPFALMPYGFFDADFRYVDGIDPCKRTIEESLKRIELNDCWMFSTGGQVWGRFMNEYNSRLTEDNNSYLLGRTRVFGDLYYQDVARVYGEYIWADSFSEDLAPAAIDVNRGDILNLFVDVHAFDYDSKPVYVRMGRQELLLGSQRLISTLDWANTRRTFDGVRVFRSGEKWDFDAFFSQVVPPLATQLDRADENQDFAGSWLTYRPEKGKALDMYYLYLDNSNAVVQQQLTRSPARTHTLGTRWSGDRDGFLWDYEVMTQFGEQTNADIFAAAATAGVGRHWKDATWSPTAWLYYDFASGDGDPNDGDAHTFNQLYPFGHYYLGWIDQVGRQNIHDVSLHYTAYPVHWMTSMIQLHNFWLANSQDALYNAGGNAIRRDPTGQSGNHVGTEIDFLVNFHLNKYSDLLVGYSHLFGGDFLENTATARLAADSSLTYLMYQRKW